VDLYLKFPVRNVVPISELIANFAINVVII
jgi:hypothetical protein